MTKLTNILRRVRQELGYTQVSLAKLLHVSQPAIQLWEDGSRKIPIWVAKRLIQMANNDYILSDFYLEDKYGPTAI